MEWMLDTANLVTLRSMLNALPIAGVTTNPTILKAEMPIHVDEHLAALKALCGPRPLHVQLNAQTAEEMLTEAEALTEQLGRDIYLKVPATEEGLKVMMQLKARNYRVTATVIYTPLQGMLAISAGADYLAPYCNRMEQNAMDFGQIIGQLRRMIDRDHMASRILGASFKNAGQVVHALDCGAHAVTVQPVLIKTALHSALITDAVDAFRRDYESMI